MNAERRAAIRILALLAFLCLVGLKLFAADGDSQTFRRFALYIGSNSGGKDTVTLSYATSDARTLASVMTEVGGVAPSDTILLTDPGVSTVERSFRQIADKVSHAKQAVHRVEFIMYYSGHSDEDGLLLGADQLSYGTLRKDIEATGADVKIAILDSCSSGSFTRLKGGTRQAAFMVDESVSTTGYAFLTSSSVDEAAQESDRIGASFFTYYFVSALRGAADTIGDGRVTLNEAYSYASSETLARTENTEAGPQHPSYEIRLSGSGDLVLTDLRATTAAVVVDEAVDGRLFIRDANGRLAAETRKSAGNPLTLSLPPGRYTLSLERPDGLSETNVSLRNGVHTQVSAGSFTPVEREATRSRGSDQELENVTTYFGLLPTWPLEPNRRVVHSLALSLIDNSYRIEGFDIGLGTVVQEDVRGTALSPLFNVAGKNLEGFQGAGLFNTAGGTIRGAQAAGVLNFATGPIRGAQAAGVFNVSDGSVYGGQGGGVFNITNGDLAGFQGAGVFNIAYGEVTGGQGAGVFNISSGPAEWFQGAGVFNVANGDFAGLEGAGIFNVTNGEVRGVQMAGVFNITNSTFKGFQSAGVFNVAQGLSGVQLSVVNVAGDTHGGQIGLVNVANDVYGTQVGLVNISRNMHGIPFGLVNISQNGLFNPSFWSDQDGIGYLGFQMGAGNVYSLFYGGFPLLSTSHSGAFGVGLGVHTSVDALFLDMDISAKEPLSWGAVGQSVTAQAGITGFPVNPSLIFPSFRAIGGIQLWKTFALFGGLVLEGNIPGATVKSDFHTGTPVQLAFGGPITLLELYPRWFLGLRF